MQQGFETPSASSIYENCRHFVLAIEKQFVRETSLVARLCPGREETGLMGTMMMPIAENKSSEAPSTRCVSSISFVAQTIGTWHPVRAACIRFMISHERQNGHDFRAGNANVDILADKEMQHCAIYHTSLCLFPLMS